MSNECSPFPRHTPESQGVSSRHVAAWVKSCSEIPYVHNFMLLRHGVVIAEGSSAPYQPSIRHSLYSVTKSFVSCAVGFAVREKRLSLDDRIVSFFPDKLPETMSEGMDRVTVRHLLTMSSGHDRCALFAYMNNPDDPAQQHKDWVKAFLASPLKYEPGTHFAYNSGGTYMLSAILRRVTGMNFHEYLEDCLFRPLGISALRPETCPMGTDIGGWGLSLTVEEMARFGQLLLQGGKWNGKQLLPPEYLKEAVSFRIDNSSNSDADWRVGYGYQFWQCRNHAFRCDGAYGQYIVVMPDQDMVMAMQSGFEGGSMQKVMDALWEDLLPGISPEPVSDSWCAKADLDSLCRSLAVPVPAPEEEGAAADPSSWNTVFRFRANAFSFRTLKIEAGKDSCTLTFQGGSGPEYLHAGFGAWKHSLVRLAYPMTERVAACARREGPDVLEIFVCRLEKTFREVFRLERHGRELTLSVKPNAWFMEKPWDPLAADQED